MNSQPLCELCGALDNLKICSGCGLSYYCSREHQLSNWKKHKSRCRAKSKSIITSISSKQTVTGKKGVANVIISEKSRTPGSADDMKSGIVPTDIQPSSVQVGSVIADSSIDKCQVKESRTCEGTLDKCVIGSHGENLLFQPETSTTTSATATSSGDFDEISDTSRCKSVTMAPDLDSKTESLSLEMTSVKLEENNSLLNESSSNSSDCNLDESDNNNSAVPTTVEPMLKLPHPVDSSPSEKGKRKLVAQDRCLSSLPSAPNASSSETKLADYVVKMLFDYGICVVDTFMGEEKGNSILKEVQDLKNKDGAFKEGQTTMIDTNLSMPSVKIRGDQILWVETGDPDLTHVSVLISRLDAVMLACTKKLGSYNISGRTKAMIACYPGKGQGYMKHIDNPNGDGRCITCIYYINKDWDVKKHGGLLRIFPSMFKKVADIVPKFDRLLFFWSDRRNPHEVQPAYRSRLAITVWYFDAEERKRARIQYNIKEASQQNFVVRSNP